MGGRNSWKDYFESLSPLLRSDLERKRRVIGFSLEEWGAVVEALFEERADEWRAFRQTMSKQDIDLLVDALATERLKGRHEIFHARRTRAQGQLSPVVKVDLNSGSPQPTPELETLADDYDRRVNGIFRENIESICIELGYGLRDWELTYAAIILENQPAIPLIQKRWGEMFELLMAEMTTERLRGRREALTRLQTITN